MIESKNSFQGIEIRFYVIRSHVYRLRFNPNYSVDEIQNTFISHFILILSTFLYMIHWAGFIGVFGGSTPPPPILVGNSGKTDGPFFFSRQIMC